MIDEAGSCERPAQKGEIGGASATAGPKAIVLFSDGTNNSSAKLFKTNVWRMYEAVDLGATAIDPRQIVHYDEGVGNSGFRPFAILGSVFGWGLKRNVIELYSFLCRNYDPNEQIFVFGFSRGAFTARTLVGLIAKEGLVPYRNEADLAHQAEDAFRAYIHQRVPRFPPMRFLLPAWRTLVRLLLLAKRALLRQEHYDATKHHYPRIRFVGVWDTVAAYGGPIVELVRAFDDWIRPLSFKDQKLSDKVDFGRHALALDDERDAFQPVPWDEPWPLDRDRLKQVWLSGAHADVGGGYPDDSLAYVSLAWMMEEAQAAGLQLRSEKIEEANRIANAFGPIHDPRAGFGSYYRYQPRLVGAYVEPPEPGTESIEDPQFQEQGLNHRGWIHESVFHRIAAGTDGYAPITLPRDFRIVDHAPEDPSFPQPLRANLEATSHIRADHQESFGDLVWFKRLLYFAIVFASLGLASMPLWIETADKRVCVDARCVAGTLFGWLQYVLPGFAEPWTAAFSAGPGWALLFVLLIVLFRSMGAAAERRLRDNTRRLWRQSLAGRVNMPASDSPVRRMRTSRTYQATLKFIKWQLLPIVFGLLMLFALIWLAAVVAAQVRLAANEHRGAFCTKESGGAANFTTANPCNRLPLVVRAGQSYEVRFHVPTDWQDGSDPDHKTSPSGLAAHRLAFPWGYLAAPFRRVVTARYLQPLVATKEPGRDVHIQKLQLSKLGENVYGGEFKAATSGRVTMFANDAVPPWPFDRSYFYSGSDRSANRGSACVAIGHKSAVGLNPLIVCSAACSGRTGNCSWHFADPKLDALREERERSRVASRSGRGPSSHKAFGKSVSALQPPP
jgi:uncharacterized protein (DUF2235 family)